MKKIYRNRAEKIYNQGKEIFMCPNKCRVNSWITAHLNKDIAGSKDFNQLCNEYWYYNCNNEVGNRIAFYID